MRLDVFDLKQYNMVYQIMLTSYNITYNVGVQHEIRI